MKTLILSALLIMAGLTMQAQDTLQTDTVTLIETVEELISVITNNPNSEIVTPAPVLPYDANSAFQWFLFIYALLSPLLTFVILKFFPSTSRKELIIKSTAIGITLLIIIVVATMEGPLNPFSLFQVIAAFAIQAINYDKVYNPIGLKSAKKSNYKA